MMFLLGGVFARCGGRPYHLGRKIEREKAEAWAAYNAEQAVTYSASDWASTASARVQLLVRGPAEPDDQAGQVRACGSSPRAG